MKVKIITPTLVAVEGHVSDKVTNTALVNAGITNYRWIGGCPEHCMYYSMKNN